MTPIILLPSPLACLDTTTRNNSNLGHRQEIPSQCHDPQGYLRVQGRIYPWIVTFTHQRFTHPNYAPNVNYFDLYDPGKEEIESEDVPTSSMTPSNVTQLNPEITLVRPSTPIKPEVERTDINIQP